ncbi:MAG: acyl-ACP desaturase [Nitrospirota bacterium]
MLITHKEALPEKPLGGQVPTGKTPRERAVYRAFQGLYRLYVRRADSRRWNADSDFDWKSIRKDLSPEVQCILRGFFAVEQFVPDYTGCLADLFRPNYGRSQYQLQWGVEEARHADVWRNALRSSTAMSLCEIEDYSMALRQQRWSPPWDGPIEMLFYAVFQERATQLTYLDMAGLFKSSTYGTGDGDPVLYKAAMAVAVDEAAHYRFFLEGARLYLYYFPEESLEALQHVINCFEMPAMELIDDYAYFKAALIRRKLYSRAKYSKQVIAHSLRNLGIGHVRLLRDWKDSGAGVTTVVSANEHHVRSIFAKIKQYESDMGFPDHHSES